MQDIYNGISAAQREGAAGRKGQRSNSQGARVEIARLDSVTVAMRNSRDPKGVALIYPAGAVRAMVSALRAVRGIDPSTGHHYDDTRRYVDAAPGLGDDDRRNIFEANARRVFPRLEVAA